MMLVINGKSSELFLMLRNVKYFFWWYHVYIL